MRCENFSSSLLKYWLRTTFNFHFSHTILNIVDKKTSNLFSPKQLGIAFPHEKREIGKFVDCRFLTGKSDEKNEKLSSLN